MALLMEICSMLPTALSRLFSLFVVAALYLSIGGGKLFVSLRVARLTGCIWGGVLAC